MISDRLSARVDHIDENDQQSRFPPNRSAGETMGRSGDAPTRVTDASVSRLAARLTDLDRQVVDTLSTVRIATGSQLRRLHWPETATGRRMARHHLAKLTDLRILTRLDRRIGGVRAGSDGFTYALDVAGLRLISDGTSAGRTRRPTTPGDRYLAHALAVTEAFVTISQLTVSSQLELLGFEAEPACWRTYPGAAGRPLTIKPDAFALLADSSWEHRWFLEVDRATEHRTTILRKSHDYITYWRTGVEQRIHDLFPKVLWIVPDERRATALRAWLTELEPDTWQLFQVCLADDLAAAVLAAAESEVEL